MAKGENTSIGAGDSAFPRTRWEDLLRAREQGPAALRQLLEEFAVAYWRPVYKFIRLGWGKSNEDAKELTQEFFATIMQPEFLTAADPDRGNFRNFLIGSVKNFLRDQEKHRTAQKRGGGAIPLPIDLSDPLLQVAGGSTPEEEFLVSWSRTLLDQALAELRDGCIRRGRPQVFEALREYSFEVEPGRKKSYADVARAIGRPLSEVTNLLAEARGDLERILRERVRRYVSSEADVDSELKALFGTIR